MAMPELYARLFSASETVTEIVRRYAPLFLMGSIMFFVQMTLQNINVALGQALSALLLAVTRKAVILIPLCFVLTHFPQTRAGGPGKSRTARQFILKVPLSKNRGDLRLEYGRARVAQ